MKILSKERGEFLVKLARRTIENFVQGKEIEESLDMEWLKEKRGVFTTLETYPDNKLRGCVGIPYPIKPLKQSLIESAKDATRDPRFPLLDKSELDKIIVEISILTKPEKINVKKPDEYMKKIEPKKDGLIIQYGIASGLFLPTVWKQITDKKDFLDNLCWKAGLPAGTWRSKKAILYRFWAQVFKEEKPNGNVIEVSE